MRSRSKESDRAVDVDWKELILVLVGREVAAGAVADEGAEARDGSEMVEEDTWGMGADEGVTARGKVDVAEGER